MRPDIPSTMMAVAHVLAERGTCTRRKVGAVIATHRGNVLASGYNGAPHGMPHCELPEPFSCTNAVHAEVNAIFDAARRGVSTEGKLLFCTLQPCARCAAGIIQSGISMVWYAEDYDTAGTSLLARAGITVEKLAVR